MAMAEQEEAPYEPLFTPADRPSQQNAYIHTSDVARSSQQGNKVDGSYPVKETSFSKQNSLLHQSSSYLKQATSGLMRWQSRRAFWSAVDQSDTQPPGGKADCGLTWSAVAFWSKTMAEVSRRHPSVLVATLLLLCGCLAGGLSGVIVAAKKSEQRARDDTATLARQAASSLELLIDVKALQPPASLASLVREQPNAGQLGTVLPAVMPRLLQQQVLTESPVRQILLAPFGIVNSTYSPADAAGSTRSSGTSSMFALGDSLWMKGSTAAISLAVTKRLPVVSTVVINTTATGSAKNGLPEMLLIVYHPVYLTGVASANETWGNTESEDYSKGICSQAVCFESISGTKLWGFTLAVVSLSAMVRSPESGLQDLADGKYQYRLTVLPSGSEEWVDLAVSQEHPHHRDGMAAVPVRLAGPRAGEAVEAQATKEILFVDHDDVWQTPWEGPLIAVVVVVSLALCAFLFTVLFNYWRHIDILQAMLPEKVIRVLGTGSHYYQHFDCVTVLYADVVRYTTAKPQQGDTVPTLEVVKLLNDVHSMYEAIIEKYGLVRIRRSGESFLCVGGCPIPDDPVAVAVKVAACARDLVLATSRFRGAGGFRVQIKLGLHSGPAVAAVVGSKMPRFSLFGDVVDVAYYMEATSRVMAIHLSDRTSQLLTTANDPFLQLKPRGRQLDIIGQGSMNTSWLRLDQLPDPTEMSSHSADDEEEEEKQGAGKAKGKRAGKKMRGAGEGSQAELLTSSPPPP